MIPIKPASIPHELRRDTIGTMPVEEPIVVRPSYVLIRNETGELFLYDTERIDPDASDPKVLLGKVAVMRVALVTEDVLNGYVIDLRHIKSYGSLDDASESEMPTDQEEANVWLELRQHEIPVAAAVLNDVLHQGPEPRVVGDERFAKAALHLAKLVDDIAAKIANEAEKQKAKTSQKTKVSASENIAKD